MHEFSIVSALLDLVSEEARKHEARAVTKIIVKIGTLSGVVDSLFEEAFHACKIGSIAADAELEIIIQAIEIHCSCGYAGTIELLKFSCPQCGSDDIKVTDGEDMFLQRLELELDEDE